MSIDENVKIRFILLDSEWYLLKTNSCLEKLIWILLMWFHIRNILLFVTT